MRLELKTNEVLTVYLRKRQVYIHQTGINIFGNTGFSQLEFAAKLGEKECGLYLKGIVGSIIK